MFKVKPKSRIPPVAKVDSGAPDPCLTVGVRVVSHEERDLKMKGGLVVLVDELVGWVGLGWVGWLLGWQVGLGGLVDELGWVGCLLGWQFGLVVLVDELAGWVGWVACLVGRLGWLCWLMSWQVGMVGLVGLVA